MKTGLLADNYAYMYMTKGGIHNLDRRLDAPTGLRLYGIANPSVPPLFNQMSLVAHKWWVIGGEWWVIGGDLLSL